MVLWQNKPFFCIVYDVFIWDFWSVKIIQLILRVKMRDPQEKN